MDTSKALQAIQKYYDIENPTEDDDFIFTESLKIMITETKDPKYMADLAWYYCDRKRFELEIKYLEMAAEYGYGPACAELGYMWYFGQHGEKDYKKAFDYFTIAAEADKYGHEGSLWAKYKLADMYRFGLSVDKDEAKYARIIESDYEQVKHPRYLGEPFPEISLRLAGIRAHQGKIDEAVALLIPAKRFMAERLSHDPFWGHIEVMGRIIRFLYTLTPFDVEKADFYDLFYLTETPGIYSMKYWDKAGEKKIRLEVIADDTDADPVKENKGPVAETATMPKTGIAIKYDGKWYRNFEDFLAKARLRTERFTAVYDIFYDIETVE